MNIAVDDADVMRILQKASKMDLEKPLTKACLLIENAAKEKAPVRSGELRNSITHDVSGNVGEVGTGLSYAPYVEYGTGLFSSQGNGRKDVPWYYCDASGQWHATYGQKPQPFLIPAYEENKGQVIKILKDYIKEELG